MRIRHVQIQNFKRFEALDVSLGTMDCLVGANNSGKTTLLQALALFDFCVHHCLERKNGALQLRSRTISPEDFYVLPVTNPMDIWHERRTMAGGKQRRVKVSVELDSGDKVIATVASRTCLCSRCSCRARSGGLARPFRTNWLAAAYTV